MVDAVDTENRQRSLACAPDRDKLNYYYLAMMAKSI